MRQYKFRGKCANDDEWVYGTNIYIPIKDKWKTRINGRRVKPPSVGQFTGLFDRNGKEIYEGDILNNYDEPNPLTVKWEAGGCFFGLHNQEGDCECDFTTLEVRLGAVVDAEVIGNIHEQSKKI